MVVIKTGVTQQNVRKFRKDTSVFAAWKEDTTKTIEQAFDLDISNGRLNKLIKDPSDVSPIKSDTNPNLF